MNNSTNLTFHHSRTNPNLRCESEMFGNQMLFIFFRSFCSHLLEAFFSIAFWPGLFLLCHNTPRTTHEKTFKWTQQRETREKVQKYIRWTELAKKKHRTQHNRKKDPWKDFYFFFSTRDFSPSSFSSQSAAGQHGKGTIIRRSTQSLNV